MAFPTGGEAEDGPAILRSRSWDHSQVHLNLSEFREASISPTRETLLLLSYQCEALLFPLTDGNSLSGDDPGIASCSPVQTVSTTPDLLDNIPCTSEPAGIASGSSFSPDSSSICKSYPAVCDVKSFAWGHCGDTYNQLKDADFRELLFVSGNHGVTVHAFRHPNKTNQNEISESFSKGEAGQGKWVEWSPSASAPNLSEKKPSSTFHDSPGSFWEADRTDRKGERSDDVCGESGCHESLRRPFTSKKWLRTFLTNVEMLESGGKFWTRFPGKASFPCFAEVVSFSIFDNASTFMEFILHTNPVSNNKENCSKITVLAPGAAASVNSDLTVTNSNDDSCNSSKLLSFDTNILYKCSRVFSSSSNRLVGFVLTLVDPLSVSKNEENERFWSKILLVVVLIHQWGIEWICSVKLHDTRPNLGSEFEWMDFQFSDTFLACLNASGLIFVYGATTGEFVACVDVLRICGLGPSPNVLKEEKLSAEGDISPRNANQSDQDDKQNGTFTKEVSYFCRKPLFKRLIVASRSSLFLAVDEYGVMYVFSISDFISDKYSLQKLAPSFQHFGLGVLFGWEIGASEIGCQKVVSNLSNFHSWNDALRNNETSPSAAGAGYNKLLKKENGDIQGEGFHDDSFMTGFSAIGQIEDHSISCKSSTFPMRRIFLPIDGYNEDDSIFFSPFGIIRLIKRCRIKDKHGFKLIDTCLRIALPVNDDGGVNSGRTMVGLGREESFLGEAIGCSYQGCFYLVREDGVSVVLSSISILSGVRSLESLDYWRQHMSIGGWYQRENISERKVSDRCWQPWKLEVLDRVLLYEGPEEADNISLENGWDLKIARMRRLQLALDYLKYDEIQQSLEMLVDVNLAEEGILKLLFTAVYQIFCKSGSDNELALASRLLPLATHFATKMIRKYGLLQHKQDVFMFQGIEDAQVSSLLPLISKRELAAVRNSRRLCEMTRYLEIIRNLQLRLSAKRPGPNTEDRGDAFNLRDENLPQDTAVSVTTADSVSLEAQNRQELAFPLSDSDLESTEKISLMPMESLDSSMQLNLGNFREVSILVSQGEVQGRKVFPLENPKDMIARWEMDNLDLKAVVKEALHSGRLPLAVLQLHLQRLKDLVTEKETHDTFTEVRVVGRAIAYDLFLKGETGLAVSTLQRLGEDVEISLKQLLFGTVRRSLRVQIAEEMKRYGYIGSYECKILECISVIERLYPSSSFWRTFLGRKTEVSGDSSSPTSREKLKLQLICSYPFNDLIIECSEIDGVVLGSWTSINECSSTFPVNDEDDTYPRYWVAAAVWSDSWDQRTIDRIVLDQPLHMGVYVLWESELEYHICHNNWGEVSKLLDTIPAYLLSDGNLHINLDGLCTTSTIGGNVEFLNYDRYICSAEELDAVCMDIPNIKIFRFPASNMCSTWMRMLMEQQLAKKFIFLKEYWKGTAEIVPLLARAGFIFRRVEISPRDGHIESLPALSSSNIGEVNEDAMEALHKLVIRYCAQYDLPNLLDLYLDHQKLVPDNDRLSAFLEAAGDCHWAKWLLLSRVKGHEYDASFSNARSIISRNVVPGNNLSVLEVDEIIRTVDDMAEGAEMAALATLMYAPAPIQKCLKSGSVNRHYSSSAQCTLENLRPALQRFPTLWRTLVAACFGQDTNGSFLGSNPKIVFGDSAFSDYLNWRENIFSSTGRDTSLVQMLPCWFSKDVRRLIQLFVQGPIGWQSLAGLSISESFLHRGINFLGNGYQNDEFSAISWEAAIQKNVEEELYASSLQETGFGVEHHLHRGRALAAFNHLISARVQKLKLANKYQEHSVQGQPNIQSDAQKLLAPVTQSEESLLSSVIPLAIMQFEDSVVVATCAFLLELCGLSAGMLRVDIAALRRISSYYKSSDFNEHSKHLLPNSSAFHALSADDDITLSLARALADDYIHSDSAGIIEPKGSSNMVYASKQPSHALLAVLQHLEKASLPLMVDGKTSGSWLLSGSGDGHESRSQQKAASQHWNLVTVFCQMHHIPPSTNYLAVLANDNDWVGFLTEAQVGGYPFEAIIQVASKEFNDPRLKIHILTVLKSMQSTRKKTSTSSISTSTERSDEMPFSSENSIMIPAELFGLLAECEKQKGPGEALLTKAKNLRWPLLAIIASCFPDVSPLYCLTVWLEITASRETSSIKVNDIASQIARNVGAAVEATNLLPAASRILASRYNRKNPKRRQLMEPASVDQLASTEICTSGVSGALHAQEIAAEDERRKDTEQQITVSSDPDEGPASLSKMVGVLCEKHLFLPLLRAFEMFLPSCSLLPFIRALQAFSQMRLSEASAHLASFSYRIKEETPHLQTHLGREEQIGTSWISSTAVKAAEAMLSTCPSAYEKRCLLQLLAATDFGDGGSAAMCFRRLYWKINLAEPSLRKGDDLYLGDEFLDDASLLAALEKNGHWEQARNWARQLEASGAPWKSSVHHVTETQAESMVAEWKEFLWDVPEERVALWGHCQTLFLRYSYPALQAGLFFLKHAEAVEKDVPARELHEMLLLSLQWLSGTITLSNPVYPLHLLREIETRVWLLAVESEAQVNCDGDFIIPNAGQNPMSGNGSTIIERTASMITKMDNHINATRTKTAERHDMKESNQTHIRHPQVLDATSPATAGGVTKTKRRSKIYLPSRRTVVDTVDKTYDHDDGFGSPLSFGNNTDLSKGSSMQEVGIEESFSRWEERVGPQELERAVLSLLEFGQIAAAKQLQHKLSPSHEPFEFVLVDAALKLAAISTPFSSKLSLSDLDDDVLSIIESFNIPTDCHSIDPIQALENLATKCPDGGGHGLCKRIIAVVKAANVLNVSFSEAFVKQPIELLQLLSLKAQDSLEEAKLLVHTHSMSSASIAQILAESFLKGLLAAHRGGYMDSQKEEGPAPLLWRFSDFLKWAELCPSEPEVGHALMRLVITGQEIPHACEVELLILSHHFYKSSACLDGVDVLVALAATRVEAYVSEGDFACLARLVTGVGNFHALHFILGILIENGQLDLLLQKYSAADTTTGSNDAVRGFRMAVLTSLRHFNPHDLDAFAMVYNHFDMKHETASLLESRALQSIRQWFLRNDKDQNEDLLESMRYFIEAAVVHSTIDAGNKTFNACAQASLLSLQIRMPDFDWLNLSATNARRALVEQSRFQEALIVAEAYDLNRPSEWALAIWNHMLRPEVTEQFVAEFVAVLPLQPSMLSELAKFYRSEVAARGDQSHFSVWLSPGGLPAEWAKHLGRSYRCLLKRTRDLRLRLQLATVATGFSDVIDGCMKALDRVPDTGAPLVLRKGHGGGYVPLM